MAYAVEAQPIPFFFKEILHERLTGELQVKGNGFTKTLCFSEGKLVYATSTRFDEKILIILHLMGRISEEQYNLISGLQQYSDEEICAILLQNHYVSIKDLYYARVYQFRRIALSVFTIWKGQWDFDPGIHPPDSGENFFIPMAGIITEGSRKTAAGSLLSGKRLFQILKLREIPETASRFFTADETMFFQQLTTLPPLTCREIIARINIHPEIFWRKILALFLVDAIEFVEAPKESDPATDIEHLLALYGKVSDPSQAGLAIFGLSGNSTLEEVQESYTDLRKRVVPERFGSALAPEIKKIAETVTRKLDELHAVLAKKMEPTAEKPATKPSVDDSKLRARDLFLRGVELTEQRQHSDAIILFKQVIKLTPDDGDAYYMLGLCQSENEYIWHEAEINLKKAIELHSWDADPLYALGDLFRRQNRLVLAEKCFQKVREIALEHTGAHRALSELRRGKTQKKEKFGFLKKKIF